MSTPLPDLRTIPLKGKRVLIRVDWNVPINAQGVVTDDTRIRASLPTLTYVLQEGGIPTIITHLGRPEGKREPAFSLAPLVPLVESMLNREVFFVEHDPREDLLAIASKTAGQEGGLVLLENLRFHPEEEQGDAEFARMLAAS